MDHDAFYEIDLEQGLMVTVFRGILTEAGLTGLMAVQVADPRVQSISRHLIDAREQTDVHLAWADLRRVANENHRVLASHPRGTEMRTALVAGREVDYGRMRIYQAMLRGDRAEVFRSLEEATAWLGVTWPIGPRAATTR